MCFCRVSKQVRLAFRLPNRGRLIENKRLSPGGDKEKLSSHSGIISVLISISSIQGAFSIGVLVYWGVAAAAAQTH